MLLTVKEFADHIRMHPRSIYRRIWNGTQPGVVRVGRDYRIDLETALKPPLTVPSGRLPAYGGMFTRV